MKSWAVPKGPELRSCGEATRDAGRRSSDRLQHLRGNDPAGRVRRRHSHALGSRHLHIRRRRGRIRLPPLRQGYAKGDLKILMFGERMHGSWVLVRTSRGSDEKPQWLLIKHRDEFSKPGSDIVAKEMTSVVSGRTMEQIAENKKRKVWHSNRAPKNSDAEPEPAPTVEARRRGSARAQDRHALRLRARRLRQSTRRRRPRSHARLPRHRHPRGQRLDVRAQVRRHSRARVRHAGRGAPRHAEREGQDRAVSRHRRGGAQARVARADVRSSSTAKSSRSTRASPRAFRSCSSACT